MLWDLPLQILRPCNNKATKKGSPRFKSDTSTIEDKMKDLISC